MSANLASETILQRSDDPTAVGVVLRVGRRHQHHIEWQTDLVATDLHIALFEHVEQTDLDALGKVGQFVDRKDAAVGARNEAVMQSQFVREIATLGDFDGIDFTDEIGNGRIRRGELFAESITAVHPRNRSVVTARGDEIPSVL